MDISERKLKILAGHRETYKPASRWVPVLCEALNCSVSSATIRNEMADLPQRWGRNSLILPAGRIPSHAGYRLYIDKLMEQKPLSEEGTAPHCLGSLSGSADNPEHLLKTLPRFWRN